MFMVKGKELWDVKDENIWLGELDKYWLHVKCDRMEIEKSFNNLNIEDISRLNKIQWYKFLREKYYYWKYTVELYYRRNIGYLDLHVINKGLNDLFTIKRKIVNNNCSDIRSNLLVAKSIGGLGVAGASGLLAVLHPSHYATVDQFVVKTLQGFSSLRYDKEIQDTNPKDISLRKGVYIINLLRNKARELNKSFESNTWTPRRLDMVLWQYNRKPSKCCDENKYKYQF